MPHKCSGQENVVSACRKLEAAQISVGRRLMGHVVQYQGWQCSRSGWRRGLEMVLFSR